MPNHKHIRRRTFPDHHESGQKIYCDDSEQKLSALHAPTTCSSAVSNDIPPLGHLFLLADQVLHEKEAKNSNEQGPRHREKAPGKKSRIKATNNRRASPKGPKESTELHSGKSSRGRYVRSPRSSMRNIPSDAACVSTRESGASGSVAREKTVETGAVSFDSSTDEHQSKAVRSDRLDSLVPKTVTITKEQEMRLGSSSSEVADDAAEFVLTSGDSSERSNGEIELSSLSAEQKAATKQAPVFLATTKSALAAQLEKVPSTSVTIEEEVDDKANSVSNTEKRQSLSPEEISIAESISYRAFNRSAFVTRTAVKKVRCH